MQLTKKHKAYFDMAKAMSKLSDHQQIQIGTVITYKHRVISSGHNSTKTHPLQKKYNIYRFDDVSATHSLHSEMQALLPLIDDKNIDFSKVCLYNYRRRKDGKLGISRPCPSCMALIRELGIRHIYYTNESSYVHEELIN